jgi:dihydroorotate dehydrogenase (fumarate)
MADLSVKYLGLDLKSPVVSSSSGLTGTPDRIREMEAAGAGAVVLKSLFEEQILFEGNKNLEAGGYPEAEDYVRGYIRDHAVGNYLGLIEEVKRSTSLPVIASINCVTSSEWVDFARKIEEAGADALELNVYFLPLAGDKPAREYEKVYFELAEKMKGLLQIPVSFKLSRQFTNLNYVVTQLSYRKADGVVLFNRFYEPDIDVDRMEMTAATIFSTPAEIRQTLRWVGLLSGQYDTLSLAASTGVHDAKAVIKLLLAGADVAQVCSVLYEKGISYISEINRELSEWMEAKGFSSINDFRGKLSYHGLKDPVMYERSQFMKYFSDHT